MATIRSGRVARPAGRAAGAALLALAALCVPPAARGQAPPPPAVDSSVVPADVSIPGGFSGNPIAFFDDYSWRAFVALVWPGRPGRQGEPAPAPQTVDGPGPRVFETYKSLAEVFHSDGSAPAPWDQYDPPAYNPCGAQTAYGDMTLGSFSKFSNLGQAGFGTLLGPLVAQNTTYVRYLTGYNRTAFGDIRDKQWYLRSNLPAAPASVTFDNGALTVKSAWIDMRGVRNPGRFYVRKARVLDPVSGDCANLDVGLVGLHIVQKTPSRPQWIWSSFEHVDCVPPPQPGAPGTFVFNDGTGAPMPPNNPYPLSRALVPPTAPPFNVTRVKPIHASTVATNNAYHAALAPASKWKFYQLVMTQWPTTANAPALPGSPNNTFPGSAPNDQTAFANVALETFEQRSVFTGCMSCHNATMKPTDFVWSLNDHAFPASSATPNLLMKNPSFRGMRDLLLKGRRPD